MSKRKDMPLHEEKKPDTRINQRVDPADPIARSTLRQDLTLSRGEREKGASPANSIGKKVEQEERKGRK